MEEGRGEECLKVAQPQSPPSNVCVCLCQCLEVVQIVCVCVCLPMSMLGGGGPFREYIRKAHSFLKGHSPEFKVL